MFNQNNISVLSSRQVGVAQDKAGWSVLSSRKVGVAEDEAE